MKTFKELFKGLDEKVSAITPIQKKQLNEFIDQAIHVLKMQKKSIGSASLATEIKTLQRSPMTILKNAVIALKSIS